MQFQTALKPGYMPESISVDLNVTSTFMRNPSFGGRIVHHSGSTNTVPVGAAKYTAGWLGSPSGGPTDAPTSADNMYLK